MRRALIVGINEYSGSPTRGCVRDAKNMAKLLEKNDDGSPNFAVRLMTQPSRTISRSQLWQSIEQLFEDAVDVCLLYFAGHGTVGTTGGYIIPADAKTYEEGISMDHILTLANKSKATERIIIIDCCHSGVFGNPALLGGDQGFIREGVSIIAASRGTQSAMEEDGRGVFTALMCDGLKGGAADVRGNVTTGSVYTYIDQALGAWDQRPTFKSNVFRFAPIRRCKPAVSLEILRKLPQYYESPETELRLDPSYEPDAEPADPEHEDILRDLQICRDAHLVEPVGAEHLYFAAIRSKSCRLTPLGRQYWRLCEENMI